MQTYGLEDESHLSFGEYPGQPGRCTAYVGNNHKTGDDGQWVSCCGRVKEKKKQEAFRERRHLHVCDL